MAKDQVLSKGVWFSAVVQCGKIGNSNDHYRGTFTGAELKVICKSGSAGGINNIQMQTPDPKPGQVQFLAPIKVNYASFKATPKELSATCPAKAKFTGNIGATGPGSVKYRVKFPGNQYTAVRTLSFDKAGTKSIGIVEYPTNQSLANAQAVLEVLEPEEKKVFTNFSVNCIAGGGPGSIQQQPSQNAAPGLKVNKANTPKLPILQAKPATEPDPEPAPRRLPARETEEETRETR